MRCSACDARFPTIVGVLDLRVRMPSEQVERSLEKTAGEASSRTWPELVRRHVEESEDRTGSLYEATVIGRASWTLLMDLRPDASVLDLGSG